MEVEQNEAVSGKRFLLCKRNNHYLLTDDCLLSLGIKMAAEPVEDNCISFVEMNSHNVMESSEISQVFISRNQSACEQA